MTLFRRFGLVGAFAMALAGPALAQSTTTDDKGEAVDTAPSQIEFVQQAAGMSYADGKLTLRDPAALTIFFADRPKRFTGHMPNSEFANYWDAASDSFAKDPPNAAVMVASPDNPPAIVELKSFTLLDSGDIVYEIDVLEGEVPANGEAVALFIDPVAYVGPHVDAVAGPRGAAAVVHPAPVARVVVAPRCHVSPYYAHDVCRVY